MLLFFIYFYYLTHTHQVQQVGPRLTQNAHVISAVPLGFRDDGREGVGKVLEQRVLLLHLHAQDTVQELADVVVVLLEKKIHSNVTHIDNITKRTFSLESPPRTNGSSQPVGVSFFFAYLCRVSWCRICPRCSPTPLLLSQIEFLQEKQNGEMYHMPSSQCESQSRAENRSLMQPFIHSFKTLRKQTCPEFMYNKRSKYL